LIVTVTDGSNMAIRGLAPNDFEVFEEGIQQPNIAVGNVATPVSVVLDIDCSASVEPVLPDIQAAARDFLGVLNEATDEAGVIKFATEVILAQAITPLQGNLQALFSRSMLVILDQRLAPNSTTPFISPWNCWELLT
jgi:hypothetical protein